MLQSFYLDKTRKLTQEFKLQLQTKGILFCCSISIEHITENYAFSRKQLNNAEWDLELASVTAILIMLKDILCPNGNISIPNGFQLVFFRIVSDDILAMIQQNLISQKENEVEDEWLARISKHFRL